MKRLISAQTSSPCVGSVTHCDLHKDKKFVFKITTEKRHRLILVTKNVLLLKPPELITVLPTDMNTAETPVKKKEERAAVVSSLTFIKTTYSNKHSDTDHRSVATTQGREESRST